MRNSYKLRVVSGEFPRSGKLKALFISCLFVLFVVTVMTGFTYGVRRGVVGHWQYHGNVATSGILYDLSGNGINGTLTGSAYVNKDGINISSASYVNVANSLLKFSYNDLFSVSGWVYHTADTRSIQRIFTQPANANRFNYAIGFDGSTGLIYGSVGKSYVSDISVAATLSDYTWSLATLTYDGSDIRFYLDGEYIGSESYTYGAISDPDLDACIGDQIGKTAWHWAGIIDDVRIYNRALSAEEIKQLYYLTKGRHNNLPRYVLVSDYYTSPLTFVESGTSNGKAKYVYDANNYIEWDGSTDWVIYLDDGIATQCFSITSATDTPPEAPSNTWTADYFFSMTSLTQQ